MDQFSLKKNHVLNRNSSVCAFGLCIVSTSQTSLTGDDRSFLKHTVLSKERDSVYALYNNNSGFTYYGVQTHIPSWRASERDLSRTTQFPVWPSNSFYDDWISRFAYIPIPVFNWNLLFPGINELYVYYLLDNDNNYYYRVVAKSAAGRAPYTKAFAHLIEAFMDCIYFIATIQLLVRCLLLRIELFRLIILSIFNKENGYYRFHTISIKIFMYICVYSTLNQTI